MDSLSFRERSATRKEKLILDLSKPVKSDGMRHYYLGRYQSAESKQQYARLIAEHFRNDGVPSVNAVPTGPNLTVSELILRYWTEHVQVYYRKNGELSDR